MALGVSIMNIIGFVGSPHKAGNTAWSISKVLEGAKNSKEQKLSYFMQVSLL